MSIELFEAVRRRPREGVFANPVDLQPTRSRWLESKSHATQSVQIAQFRRSTEIVGVWGPEVFDHFEIASQTWLDLAGRLDTLGSQN